MDEAGDLDLVEAGFRQRIDQSDLAFGRQEGALDLQPVARPDLADDDALGNRHLRPVLMPRSGVSSDCIGRTTTASHDGAGVILRRTARSARLQYATSLRRCLRIRNILRNPGAGAAAPRVRFAATSA